MSDLASEVAQALAHWCEDTGNAIGSQEEASAVKEIEGFAPGVGAAILAEAAHTWLHDSRLDPSIQFDELQWVLVIAEFVRCYTLTVDDKPDHDAFRRQLVARYDSPEGAAAHALGLIRGWLEADRMDHVLAAAPESVEAAGLDEVRLWCMSTAPGYAWLHVEPLGWVLYRSGNF